MIPRETIDRIYAAAKIEEVVGDYVSLRKRGANLIGLCPFHHEKTGSFTVSPSKGIYKCFGCGVSGNAVGFIREIEQCSFVEAVKQLGKKYHIEVEERELSPEEQQRQDNRESMFVVNDFCNHWFQNQLWETEEGKAIGLSYFRERGLRDDIIRKYQLGYSPEKGNPLATTLQKQGFKEEFITNNVDTKIGCGVVGKSEDGRLYDRFRDRVIFPILTLSGKTVAFAGRILKKKENVGKYVNSPDSIIYSKTNELYGIFQAKQSIARQDMCYLVEGQMDVISMHQSGIENVVASGGTALTKPQIRLIKRFTSNITVLYDGDAAGIHAALRGIDMFLEEGFNVKVVLLPDGEDPDSFAQNNDSTVFIQYIQDHQTDFIRFKLALLSESAGDDPQKRAALIRDITASIAIIPDMITRQVYIKDSAERLHISEQVLTREVISLRRKLIDDRKRTTPRTETDTPAETQSAEPSENPTASETSGPTAERSYSEAVKPLSGLDANFYNLIQLVVRYGERPVELEGTIYSIGDVVIYNIEEDEITPTRPVFQRIMDEFKRHSKEPNFNAERFFKFHSDTEISSIAVEMIADQYRTAEEIEPHLGELVTQLLYEIKLTVINQQIEDLSASLKEAETAGDWNRIKTLLSYQPELLQRKNDICKQLGNRIITI
ncbi:MAG: DNA primase [Paludibacteraceae bacterium]|nr:DNA primase [Paludibacteraceae bacterium]